MHYYHLLLLTFAALVVAKSNESPRNWGFRVSDELAVADLRQVSALTYYIATPVVNQDTSPPTMAANANDNSASKLKRNPNDIAHQPHKRVACDPLPTLPNTYNIN